MKKITIPVVLIMWILSSSIYAQIYDDYLGAGHDKGIKVWTSDNAGVAIGQNTINGEGLDAMKYEASRFLSQAAFGGTSDQIIDLVETENDFSAWIDDQFQEPTSWMLPALYATDDRAERLFYIENDTTYVDENGEMPYKDADYFGPYALHFQYTWWDQNIKGNDKLRQRVAFALSQILVVSTNSNLDEFGEGLASYYDNFMRHSFGNYKDLLLDVSLDPNMGYYLSHLNNNKTDAARGVNPDENYAREIMQLFSIGLYELNNDGTRKIDGSGAWIPTYDNNDIKGLAKVFTGLKGGRATEYCAMYFDDPDDIEFGTDIYCVDKTVPMKMYEGQHEPGEKDIVGGYTIPSGQTGMQDIQAAVDHLFDHDNVGPFLATRLIQQLVKSNPTPAYVNRVASAFNNNGQGVRGDMKAVIRAVLLDNEARDCGSMEDPNAGKLREPIMRFTHIINALPHTNPDGYYWNNSYDYNEDTKQAVLNAPSVFNFYSPEFQAQGQITEADLVSPEFQIHDSQTSLGYINQVHKWSMWNDDGTGGTLFWDWIGEDPNGTNLTPNVQTNLLQLAPMAEDPETLINHLDIVLTHGRLSNDTRATIKDAITAPIWALQNADDHLLNRVKMAVYLFMISPDYVILK